ncbi:MAG: VOC family protein [Planctomycetota bacterium]
MKIPPGFHTIAPYFIVQDAPAFIAFLEQGLGGKEVQRTCDDAGTIRNAMVRLGDSTVMLSEASEAWPAMPASYYLYVEDAHAAMTRATSAGATAIMAVADMPYGDRQGGVRDAFGNLWWLSQRLEDGPYSA